jgi:hypothetical protein
MSFASKFGNDFITGFLGVNTLKDFSHASKTFKSNGYELAPKLKFLYHVYFDINKAEIPALNAKYDDQSQIDIGMLVKSITLPKFDIKTEDMNQYNRKRIIQTKLEYSDVTVEMHDDGANLTRNLWYDYMTYYFRDSTYNFDGQTSTESQGQNPGFKYSERDIYKGDRTVNDWGYSGDGSNDQGGYGISSNKPNFFKSIKIFGMDKRRFVCYVLVNPYITQFGHDTYNYSEAGGIMTNTMQLKFETVKYYEGTMSAGEVTGFGQPSRYDTEPSSLGTAGSQPTVLGQAGILDAGNSIVKDLASGNILGAVRTAGITAKTVSSAGLGNILKNEGTSIIREGILSSNGMTFPKLPKTTSPTVATQTNTFSNTGRTII